MIPKAARPRYLEILHKNHASGHTMQDNARKSFYWPNINNQIDNYYKNCPICAEVSRKDYVNPPSMDAVENQVMPMEVLNIDWAEMGQHKYLIVVDRATVFMWVGEFSAMTTENTISFLLSIFSTFGTPLEIRSDSGPSFRATYESKMQELGIDTQFSAAYHPQGN